MALEGSLETVALPEVLHLLADTNKTGELLVRGDRGNGRLWFDGGGLTAFDVGRSGFAVDAIFDLLRISSGAFVFDTGQNAPDEAHRANGGTAVSVVPVLEQAESRLAEWVDIVAVIPSLEHELFLAEQAPEGGVKLDKDEWALVVAIGEGRSASEVLDERGLGEFEGCKTVKALVDRGVVEVQEPESKVANGPSVAETASSDLGAESGDAGAEPPTEAREALRALLNDMAVSPVSGAEGLEGRGAEEVQPGAAASEAAPEEDQQEPINRGLLLKFLSSVRS